jgi:hypothetical protein
VSVWDIISPFILFRKPPAPRPAPAPSSPATRPVTLKFVLYNLAVGRDDVTPVLPAIRDALDWQANGEFADAYGGVYQFRVGQSPFDRAKGEVGINIRHTVPAEGAIAYHAVTNGVPDIEMALDLVRELTTGTECLSSALSHEVLETALDPGANRWATRGDGQTADALEACDFAQNTGYSTKNGVWVSNFLLPSVWVPGSLGPWDHLGKMTNQYDVSNGYGIQGTIDNVQQIQGRMAKESSNVRFVGSLTDLQRARKSHPYSRATRRGLVLAT